MKMNALMRYIAGFIIFFTVFHCKTNGQQVIISEISLPQEIRSINAILVKDTTLWLATAQGLYAYNNIEFVRFYDETQAESYHINALCTDRFGNIWLGNYNGLLVKFSGEKVIASIDIKPFCKMDNYLITSISIDKETQNKNTAILMTTSGGEIFAYDTISRKINKIDSPGEGTIYAVNYGYCPTKWLCTSDGFFEMSKNSKWKKKSDFYTVYHICENEGKYWGVGRDNDKKALLMLYYRDDGYSNKFKWKEFDLQNLADGFVRFNELAFTGDEIAWIVSEKGLIRYNPTNAGLKLFEQFGIINLSSLKHIVVQNDRLIWASTSGKHLYKIEIQ